VDIDTVLGPMLAKMDKTGQAAPRRAAFYPASKVILSGPTM